MVGVQPPSKKKKVTVTDNHGFEVASSNLDAVTLERCITRLSNETSKSLKDRSAIRVLMKETYSSRRNWIVNDRPPLREILEVYPPLKDFESVSKIWQCAFI